MKVHLFLAIFGTAISSASLILMLFFIDPFQANSFLINLFYICLFTTNAGIFFLFGVLSRKNIPYPARLFISFRQAVFFAAVITGLIIMKDFNILRLWNSLVLIGGVAALEIYFSYK